MCHLVNYVFICIQCTSNVVEVRPKCNKVQFSSELANSNASRLDIELDKPINLGDLIKFMKEGRKCFI